ncbi:DUF4242 domain-containing protein [Ferruginibacter sp.]
MKLFNYLFILIVMNMAAFTVNAQNNSGKKLFIDVHHLGAGKVTVADVAAAHAKDLAVQKKYGVTCISYWVDVANGDVYCLAAAPDAASFRKTHEEAHGLLPDEVYEVTAGPQAKMTSTANLYLDIHRLGAGNVTAAAVADAHKKDLAVQKKHGVNCVNYWVDEAKGIVICLAEAADATDIIATHKEAHGLLPAEICKVVQGQ